MIEQKFGPRRCRDTRKPLAGQCPEAAFYRCERCGGLFTVSSPATPAVLPGTVSAESGTASGTASAASGTASGTASVASAASGTASAESGMASAESVSGGAVSGKPEIICCGLKAERLLPADIHEESINLEVTYQIVGGYNDNAIRISWKTKSGKKQSSKDSPLYEKPLNIKPEWIYLKTFTGGCLKYVAETKRPPVVFALADTDAFAYCDEDPCLECVFRCKRGFVIYVYAKETGLIEVPIDKMTAKWQTGAK